MGLDMYLSKYPRYKNYTGYQLSQLEGYFEWRDEPRYNSKYSLKEWCGLDESELPPKEDLDTIEKLRTLTYPCWDDEHKYGRTGISQEVAYWRKANAIHKWFVDNVQDGEDDCGMHREVTEGILRDLLSKCSTILENCVMVSGKVKNGARMSHGKWEDIMEDGFVIVNPEICQQLLPTQDGFFFGSTDYTQWYMQDIRSTYEQVFAILQRTDFEKEMIYYQSSW